MTEKAKELYPKRQEPMSEMVSRFVATTWPKIESILRRWPEARRLKMGKGNNSRLEAWLSDCAQALCEHQEEDLLATMRSSLKLSPKPRIRGYWRRIFKILAFRRFVMGWDVAEVCKDGLAEKAKRYYSESFWLRIPQNEKPEYDLEQRKKEFFKLAAKLACITREDKDLIKVLACLIECPEMYYSEHAREIKMNERTYYRKLSALRTRMTCGGALMLYSKID